MSIVGKLFGFGRDDHYDRGIRAYDRSLFEEAINQFKQCIDRSNDPATIRLAKFYAAESYAQIGSNSLKSADPAAAIRNLAAAMELHPTYPDLHYQIAEAYRAQGDREDQIKHLERALELNPGYAAAIMLLGVVNYEDGRHEEAMKRVTHAVSLERGFDNERYHAAIVAHQAGDTELALRHLNAMRNTDAIQANALAKLGDECASQGHWKDAAAQYATALEVCPRYADIRCKHGKALFQLHEVDSAIGEYETALELNPKYADAHAHLGQALSVKGESGRARAAFLAALEFNPDHALALEALSEHQRAS